MSDGERTKLSLTRRQVLEAVGTVGAAGALGGASTTAFVSDEEEFANERLVAGELDVKVGWDEQYATWSETERRAAPNARMETNSSELDLANETGLPTNSSELDLANETGLPTHEHPLLAVPDANVTDFMNATREERSPAGGVPPGADPCAALTDADREPPVIDLSDVKPGDFGEVTFALALCDNPGFVWLTGAVVSAAEHGTTDPEADDPDEGDGVELLDAVRAAVWVDDGDGYPDDRYDDGGPERIVTSGSLRDVLATLSSERGLALAGDIPASRGGGAGIPCFSATRRHHVGFAWWLPVDHANEVQTDSATFTLGLYAEQCRHNRVIGGGTSPDASIAATAIRGRTYEFSATCTPPPDAAFDCDTATYEWRVDGDPVGGDGATLRYTFETGGEHTVAVALTGDGGTTTASHTVSVTAGPVPIETVADFRALADPTDGTFPLDGAYYLAGSLDLSDVTDLRPVGDESAPFTGSFDGRRSTIRNLTLDRGSAADVGLFGVVGSGGTVTDVTLFDGTVTGDTSVGGLVGTNRGEVRDCSAKQVDVTGTDAVGGLVGTNDGGAIRGARTTATVDGTTAVGGIVGTNGAGGTVADSRTSATADGTTSVGGVAGTNDGTVRGSEATGGDISGQSAVGGVAGTNDGTVRDADPRANDLAGSQSLGGVAGTNDGTVRGCSVIATLDGNATSLGGVVGTNAGEVRDCSTRGSLTGSARVGGLVGVNDGGTVRDSRTRTDVTGAVHVGGAVGRNAAGTVRTSSVHLIVTVDGSSASVGGFVGSNAGGIRDSSTEAEVDGGSVDTGGFVGTNGAGGTVTGSSASTFTAITGTTLVGGFVGTNDGTVDDSSADVATEGTTSVGGFAGRNGANGTVTASDATGDATASSTQAGGFVGVNDGTVEGSTASGAVTGRRLVGGFAGTNGGDVRRSAASGDVTVRRVNTSSIGGLVGLNEGTVSETVADGSVIDEIGTGNRAFGGLVGTNTGDVRQSAARGDVEGRRLSGDVGPDVGTKYVGGLVGKNGTNGDVEKAYAVGGVIGFDAGSIVGYNGGTVIDVYATSGAFVGANDGTLTNATELTVAQMQGGSAATTMSALDFGTVWQTVPGAFPTLRALSP